ncbi:hypothetical protein [Kaistella sp.]|uniref:hypothetical protein n=1 Tax=Kaistella sp. TaxID=2782235 RepID=UPI00359FA742
MGNPLAEAFPTARVGLSTATPQAFANANAFCGVSVSIPIAVWDFKIRKVFKRRSIHFPKRIPSPTKP